MGRYFSAFISPFSSIGLPRTSTTRPITSLPTGTSMPLPSDVTLRLQRKPSVASSAIARATPPPKCAAISACFAYSSTVTSAFIGGICPLSKRISITGPDILIILPVYSIKRHLYSVILYLCCRRYFGYLVGNN